MSIAAVNVVLSANNDYVIAQTESTLERSENMIERAKKENSKWGQTAQGLKEWDLTGTTITQESSGNNFVGADGVASLDIDTTTLRGIQSLEVTFENSLTQVGDIDDNLWRSIRISEKAMDISVDGQYKDPATPEGAAFDNLRTAQENGNIVPFTLNFGALTFSGEVRPGDWQLDAGERGNQAEFSFDLMHNGAITKDSGTLDTGQEAILSNWFSDGRITATVDYISGDPTTDSPDTPSTTYEGSAAVETVTLTADRAEDLTMEFDLAGDGALTTTENTAA